MQKKRVAGIVLTVLYICIFLYSFLVTSVQTVKRESGLLYQQTLTGDARTAYIDPDDFSLAQDFCPVYEGLYAVAVRVDNAFSPTESDQILCFSVYNQAGALLEQQYFTADQIENWHYVVFELHKSYRSGAVYTLTVTAANQVAAMPYTCYYAKTPPPENLTLLQHGTESMYTLDTAYYYQTPERNWPSLLAVLALAAAGGMLFLFLDKIGKLLTTTAGIVVFFVLQAGLTFAVISVLSGDFVTKPLPLALNLAIIGILYMLVWAVSGKIELIFPVDFLLIFLALINHFVLLFRGTVLLPSDIYGAGTAMDVVSNYRFSLDHSLLCTILLLSFKLLLLYSVRGRRANKRLPWLLISPVLCVLSVIFLFQSSLQVRLGLEINFWEMTERSHELGFLLHDLECLQYFVVRPPQGYSPERAESICLSAPENTSDVQERPDNIIVIMNESLADFFNLGALELNTPYLDHVYLAAEQGHAKMGTCVVPVYGAGTSCSEFEFLTGCTMLFNTGSAPYVQYVRKDMASISSWLKDARYDTLALHTGTASAWGRDSAYPRLGFDRFADRTDALFDGAETVRYWISDKTLYDSMASLIEQVDQPLFEFGVTIQGHGGYSNTDDGVVYESTVHVQNLGADTQEADLYLTLMDSSDEGFGNLLDTLSQSDEKTIVLMFGDHLPALPADFYSALYTGGAFDAALEKYETPFLFWANYDVSFDEVPDVLSANFLSTYLLKCAGFSLTPYYNFLYSLSQDYPVVSRNAILDAAGNRYFYEPDSPCYEALHDYEIVQYAALH